MRAWDIAKLLMEHCKTPDDVEQIIMVLNDRLTMGEVCSMLSAFSNRKAASSHADVPMARKESRPGRVPEVKQAETASGGTTLLDTSKAAAVDQLESLFRSGGMTNKQVEQWCNTNFNIHFAVGKGSLRRFLTRLLNGADLGLTNRILAAAQREIMTDASDTSDIKSYWDELDKRFSVVE